MKTIGVVGGMSWESTLTYYRLMNEEVRLRCGGLHSASLLLSSVDFAPIRVLQQEGRWDEAGALLAEIAQTLQQAGADCIVIATNTMHKVAPAVEAAIDIPLVHIVDPTARALKQQNIRRVALLGTCYTMHDDFYKGRLQSRFGFDVLVPDADLSVEIDRIIFDELCLGYIQERSRKLYKKAIERLAAQGAQGVILGCTEIGLLVNQQDSILPVFDTTLLHTQAAVEFSITGAVADS